MGQQLDLATAAAALADAPLGILILDGDGRISWMNAALETLLAIDGKQVLGRDAAGVEQAWRARLFAPEEVLRLPAGDDRSARWLRTWNSRVAAGTIHYYADISDLQDAQDERDRLQAELAQHNTRDEITGMPNRQALLQGLEPLVARSRRYHNPLSVIRLRIDNLSDLDGEHGKGSGERTLMAVAQLLKDQLRWADFIGRFDQDEFLLVLPETDAAATEHLRDKLRQRIEVLSPSAADGAAVKVAAQFGAASWQPGDDRAKLLRRARERLEQGE